MAPKITVQQQNQPSSESSDSPKHIEFSQTGTNLSFSFAITQNYEEPSLNPTCSPINKIYTNTFDLSTCSNSSKYNSNSSNSSSPPLKPQKAYLSIKGEDFIYDTLLDHIASKSGSKPQVKTYMSYIIKQLRTIFNPTQLKSKTTMKYSLDECEDCLKEELMSLEGEDVPILKGLLQFILGKLFFQKKRFKDAKVIFTSSLNLIQGAIEINHPVLGVMFKEFGNLFIRNEKSAEALEYYSKAVEVFNYGDDWLNIGSVLIKMGEIQSCQDLLDQTYNSYLKGIFFLTKGLGSYHSDLANAYLSLGNVCIKAKKYKEAIQHLNSGLDIAIKVYGEESPKTSFFRHLLGFSFLEEGEAMEALKSHLDSNLCLAGDIDDSLLSAKYCNLVGLLYHQLGNYEDAAFYLERALKIHESHFEEGHETICISHACLAMVYRKLKQDERASKSTNYYEKNMNKLNNRLS